MIEITWEKYLNDIDLLVEKIIGFDFEFYDILTLSRGGLIPSTIISHKLHNNSVTVMGVESYEGTECVKLKLYQDPWPLNHKIPKNLLIIDDLIDSGNSIKFVKEYFKERCPNEVFDKHIYATIYNKNPDKTLVDLWVEDFDMYKWVKFPYE
jgi:hypoxanthine phosphoribosyltransferase